MRLDRFLSLHGFSSRKQAKKIVRDGRIQIDEEVCFDYTRSIDGNNKVFFDGKEIENLPYATLMMNKPEGYQSSMIDERYPSVMNLVPESYRKRVRLVGRLDNDTTGLLLLTDNGILNSRLANPKHGVPKTYEVYVNHILHPDLIEKCKQPLDIGRGDIAHVDELEILDESHARITVHEGKYHEIKRIFGKFNYDVLSLKRVRFGPLSLGELKLGECRLLTEEEYDSLLDLVHLQKRDQL